MTGAANGAPDPFGSRRHCNVGYAELAQRVDDRIDYRGGRADTSGLAGALYADRVRATGYFVHPDRERRQVLRSRHSVIEKRAGQNLPGVLVENDGFHRRLADALSKPA